MAEKYNFKKIEGDVLDLWRDKRVLDSIRKKNKSKEKFYFLQGPPYTSGRLHMGHGWNHALKDAVLRYKRMCGFDVWDRAGYDMHGLPTELKVMRELNMKFKEDILKFGLKKFNKRCRDYSVEMMKHMDRDLEAMGITLDFSDSYQPVKNEFIEGQWEVVKRADKNGRLYLGERTLSWCPDCASALAKHEQEYETVSDDSIFVKMQVKGKDNEFLVIWTTTPWTIPFNLAVMVNPELEYQRCKILSGSFKGDVWVVAKQLAGVFINGVANAEYEVLEEFLGDKLEGVNYIHPFSSDYSVYNDISSSKLHSVLLSTEYVDTSAGTGLVHCAPGCGPEDYEIGYRNGLPPFNNIDEHGEFPDVMGPFKGLVAKRDDVKFIDALIKREVLIAQTKVDHEYAHCWRHKSPVIFRTTKQWFFKIEDLKNVIVEKNKNINWVPKSASSQFDAWISNLRDNSITKQRYWGTPAPIWVNVDDESDYIVIGSRKDLEDFGCVVPEDLHKPFIDDVVIERDGKTYRRIPDVLDVWLDSGTVAWNCLYNKPELLERWYPVDCVLEGKEQIRLWFYMLAISHELMNFKDVPFKNVYCHGMLNAVDGVKMSKSLGNIISPYEISDKYGTDTMRFYLSSISAGQNISFSWDDIQQKYRTLNVLWNIHNYFVDFVVNENIDLKSVLSDESLVFEVEDKFLLSLLNSCKRDVSVLLDSYELDKACNLINDFILTFSRDFIKMVRDRSVSGSETEKQGLAKVLFLALRDVLVMSSLFAPFTCEKIYQNVKSEFNVLSEVSVSHESWIVVDEDLINEKLVEDFKVAMHIITGILGARELAGLGVRWPVVKAFIVSESSFNLDKSVIDVICAQTNVKALEFKSDFEYDFDVKPNFKALGSLFGERTGDAAGFINKNKSSISEAVKAGKSSVVVLDKDVLVKDFLVVERSVSKPFFASDTPSGNVIIDSTRTELLDCEGFAREIVRRVQDMRKKNNFTKVERIDLVVGVPHDLSGLIDEHKNYVSFKVGASSLTFLSGEVDKFEFFESFKIKGKEFIVSFRKV
ncbi:MAG: isoleucine--tRNA ligase [Candidatus Woesearchaeota archaeon]